MGLVLSNKQAIPQHSRAGLFLKRDTTTPFQEDGQAPDMLSEYKVSFY